MGRHQTLPSPNISPQLRRRDNSTAPPSPACHRSLRPTLTAGAFLSHSQAIALGSSSSSSDISQHLPASPTLTLSPLASPILHHAAVTATLPQTHASTAAIYTLAEGLAATTALQLVTASDSLTAAAAAAVAPERAGAGWLAPLVNTLEKTLYFIQAQLELLHVPYSYGFSIILLTLVVKLLTFPLTKTQVESSLAVQSLKPRIDMIKSRYGEDKDKISKETSALYKEAGVNPLAGCLPSIATIPIFIGLYNSLTNVANDGSLATQGFFWVPSLAGPTTMAARQLGQGSAWLYPLVDGAPPVGWHDALSYLSLPALLIVSQWVSSSIISPPVDPNDENAQTGKLITSLLPLMIGYFSLNVPAGLSLYYLSNSVLSSLQQVYLRKLGGAVIRVNDLGPVTKPGSGRRLGTPAGDVHFWKPTTVLMAVAAAQAEAAADAAESAAQAAAENRPSRSSERSVSVSAPVAGDNSGSLSSGSESSMDQILDPATVSRRCKRVKLALTRGSTGPSRAPDALKEADMMAGV
ncbi:MAG: hypothetical protein WDW38_006039 [Sanguina aurantia]